MTELVTAPKVSKWTEYKYRLAIAGTAAMSTLAVTASAAVNFTPIQELLEAVVDLIPTFMDLVVAIAPLIVTIGIISFVLLFLKRILDMLNF